MSQENVETLQAAYDAWNRGDLQSVLDRLHPDVKWEENPDVYPGLDRSYHGHDGFLKRQREPKPSRPLGCRNKTLAPPPPDLAAKSG
jgi:ketosteroid isomerase-like protein